MKPKNKALVFNFISFVCAFLLLRLAVIPYLVNNEMLVIFLSAFLSILIAPKFFNQKFEGKEVVFMKILLKKDPIKLG